MISGFSLNWNLSFDMRTSNQRSLNQSGNEPADDDDTKTIQETEEALRRLTGDIVDTESSDNPFFANDGEASEKPMFENLFAKKQSENIENQYKTTSESVTSAWKDVVTLSASSSSCGSLSDRSPHQSPSTQHSPSINPDDANDELSHNQETVNSSTYNLASPVYCKSASENYISSPKLSTNNNYQTQITETKFASCSFKSENKPKFYDCKYQRSNDTTHSSSNYMSTTDSPHNTDNMSMHSQSSEHRLLIDETGHCSNQNVMANPNYIEEESMGSSASNNSYPNSPQTGKLFFISFFLFINLFILFINLFILFVNLFILFVNLFILLIISNII